MVRKALSARDIIIRYLKENPGYSWGLETLMSETGASKFTVQQVMRDLIRSGMYLIEVDEPGLSWRYTDRKLLEEARQAGRDASEAALKAAIDATPEEDARTAAKAVLERVLSTFGNLSVNPADMMLIVGQTQLGRVILKDASGKMYKAKEL